MDRAGLELETDFNKLWFKSEEKYKTASNDGDLRFCRQAVAHGDSMAGGCECDLDSGPNSGMGEIGVQGFAPSFFNLPQTLYIREWRTRSWRIQGLLRL